MILENGFYLNPLNPNKKLREREAVEICSGTWYVEPHQTKTKLFRAPRVRCLFENEAASLKTGEKAAKK